MDTLPLPPRPNLEQYKKRAKDLVDAARSHDEGAVRAWGKEWLEALARLLGITITPFVQGSFDRALNAIEAQVRAKMASNTSAGQAFALADAQFLIAEAHGFENWSAFATHVEGKPQADVEANDFEAAADAIVNGDLQALEALIQQHPDLIHARSARVHRVTLLHYLAANGVEDFRQKTPPNAVAIARFLLAQNADVEAVANTYGGGNAQTTMNLLVSSTHPAGAGLQPALVEVLVDFGAAINGLDDDESPMMTALAFGYIDAAETLERRGARVDNILAAAALGRTDLVRQFVVDRTTLHPDVPFVAPHWFGMPNDAKAHIELALVWASAFGRTAVVEFLLELGVNPAAKDHDSMTALHWASGNMWLDIMKLLLRRGAPLEVENTWGGTVLDSTVHFAINQQPPDRYDYTDVLEALIAAGANVAVVTPFPTPSGRVNEVLRRHGASAG